MTSNPPTIPLIQKTLKEVIDLISKCQARTSIELLSTIMDTTVTNIEQLSLSPDAEGEEEFDRLAFWQGVNDTWLFAIQCAPNYSTAEQGMTEDDWIALRESVIAWGDVLQWFGLVDYEMGFWEEDIIESIHAAIITLKTRM